MNSDTGPGERPLISIIITSYNYAHYISESISSVLTQDILDLELIVVDNASTDETDKVVGHFTGDKRLRYYKNDTNIGLTPNHNRALKLARGEYIVFVSADDRLLPGHLRRCLNFLDAHPELDMVYTGVVFIDAQSRPYDVRNMMGQVPADYVGGRNEFAALLGEGCYIPWPSMLARRSLYDELGPLDLMTGADYEITVRWAAASKSFGYLRVPSVCIRLHRTQASGAAYVADGHDLIDYVDILKKFVIPEHWDKLQGASGMLSSHLTWRIEGYRNANKDAEVPPAIAEKLEEAKTLIAEIPHWRPSEHLGTRPLISVVVRAGTVMQVLFSLASLANQVDAPLWEAIVVSEAGHDFGPLIKAHPYGDRVRFVRIDEANAAAAARNLGARLAAGRIIAYLDAGNAFAPQHFSLIAQAFDDGAYVVRSEVRFLLCESHDGTTNTIYHETAINGIIRGAGDELRDLVAATIPIDAISHVAGAPDRVGRLRSDIAIGDVWEYWLRLKQLGPVFVPGASVEVRALRGRELPHPAYMTVARSIYRAYPMAENTELAERRNAYIDEMVGHFERGQPAITSLDEAVRVLATLYGVESPVLT